MSGIPTTATLTAHRTHIDISSAGNANARTDCVDETEKSRVYNSAELVRRVRSSIIGRYHTVPSPFSFDISDQYAQSGAQTIKSHTSTQLFSAYADWTASGRALQEIESFISKEVLPWYGNTHTSASYYGLQSSAFLDEARQIVAEACNARTQRSDAHSDVVIFTGTGATSAINHLVQILGEAMRKADSCIVLVGPTEHHSNILPWRESCASVFEIDLDLQTGTMCLASLERTLTEQRGKCGEGALIIGVFSAASNVTGIAERINEVTMLCRRFGALCCIDAASAASSLDIDMNAINVPGGLDAISFSGHKLPGGVSTPGVLVVKKRLLKLHTSPTNPGGGTVFFVTSHDHRYLSQRDEREEGGSRDLIGIVRLGLALQMKRRIGVREIGKLDQFLVENVIMPIYDHPLVRPLGPTVHRHDYRGRDNGVSDTCGRLPLASFLIEAPETVDGKTRFLHYGFVCSLLNDLFGIQTRGGCVCSGPLAHRLLNLNSQDSATIEGLMIDQTEEVLRPGFTRLSLNYLTSEFEAEYVTEAVKLIASCGWKLMPYYQYNHKSGEWKHKSRIRAFPERIWLSWSKWPLMGDKASHGDCTVAVESSRRRVAVDEHELEEMWRQQLREATKLLESLTSCYQESYIAHGLASTTALASIEAEKMRWFMLPGEAVALLRAGGRSADPAKHHIGYIIRRRIISGPINPIYFPSLSSKGVGCISIEANKCLIPENQSLAVDSDAIVSGNINCVSETKSYKSFSNKTNHGIDNNTQSEEGSPTFIERVPSKKYPLRVHGTTQIVDDNHESILPVVSSIPKLQEYPNPPPKLLKLVVRAICEWKMIRDGDRVVVGLSGGKDSLCLLHCLLHIKRKRRPPISFEIAAATVDPGTDAYNPRPLISYLESLGVTYHYIETPIMEMASGGHMKGDSICAFCSRMKRGALYSCCRTHGYNVLALGQHLDDLAESFLMSLFHNGKLRTMKACYTIDAGDLRVIRPLINVRESATREFSYSYSLPVISENCPACFSSPQERRHIKKMLGKEESLFPTLYNCISR